VTAAAKRPPGGREGAARRAYALDSGPRPTGWLLRITGPQARSPGLIDDVLDKVEERFGMGRS